MDNSEPVLVWTGKTMLDAQLSLPAEAVGLAIFASAPARPDDARDRELVQLLGAANIAVLYVPLLTPEESRFVFDAEMLASRFLDVAEWLRRNRIAREVPLCYLASNGAAAGAMLAAVQRPDLVHAVVAIDARTDFAFEHLRRLETPVLLVVKHMPVLCMNREALAVIRGEKRLEVVHETGHDLLVQRIVNWLSEELASVHVH